LLGSTTCAPSWLALSSGYIYGLTNILADWTFTLIPISILIDSDLDRRSKISVGVVMGFAAVGSVSSILRMVHLKGLMFRGSISGTCASPYSLSSRALIGSSGIRKGNYLGNRRTRHRHHRRLGCHSAPTIPPSYYRNTRKDDRVWNNKIKPFHHG
jgi:hypothetical protein